MPRARFIEAQHGRAQSRLGEPVRHLPPEHACAPMDMIEVRPSLSSDDENEAQTLGRGAEQKIAKGRVRFVLVHPVQIEHLFKRLVALRDFLSLPPVEFHDQRRGFRRRFS